MPSQIADMQVQELAKSHHYPLCWFDPSASGAGSVHSSNYMLTTQHLCSVCKVDLSKSADSHMLTCAKRSFHAQFWVGFAFRSAVVENYFIAPSKQIHH